MERPRVPVSSYAALKARREYYKRNRPVVKLMNKMYRAGIRLSTDECRAIVAQKEIQNAVHRGEGK